MTARWGVKKTRAFPGPLPISGRVCDYPDMIPNTQFRYVLGRGWGRNAFE